MEDIKEYFADKPHLKLRIWKDEYNLPVYEVRSKGKTRPIITQIYKDGIWWMQLRACTFFGRGYHEKTYTEIKSFDKFKEAADYVNKKILKEQDK